MVEAKKSKIRGRKNLKAFAKVIVAIYKMNRLVRIRKIKEKFTKLRHVIFAVNFMKKLAAEKKSKSLGGAFKSSVSPRSGPDTPTLKKGLTEPKPEEKKYNSFGIGTLMGNFFKVSQNIN